MLKVQNLEVKYGKIRAVKNVSIHLKEGEIVTIIGANGAGKTTTLKAISGVLKASEGTIHLNDVDITHQRPANIVKLGISHVPEGRRIFPQMTVLENLKMGAYIRKRNDSYKAELEEVYTHFPILKERENQLAGTLSGGEQQMLAIGRALMAKPKVLLLDEPSLGLAPILVEKIFSIIQDINKNKTPILLVEQNAYMALNIAHRGYVMETGNIVLEGEARELIDNEDVKRSYLG